MSRQEKHNLLMECFEMWARDLTDGEMNDLLFNGTSYPLSLTGWAKICSGVTCDEDFNALK